MENIICLLSLIVFLAVTSVAQTPKVSIRNVGRAKVTVAKGSRRAVIDLKTDVAGCPFPDPSYKAKGCAGDPARFELLDSRIENSKTYLVLSAKAPGNCNACGKCGADPSTALIWLELDANLAVKNKKSVDVDYCLERVSLVNAKLNDKENFEFDGDSLVIDYEKDLETADAKGEYEFSHLEYNRRQPEKGFAIKTENRTQSSIK